MVLSDSSKQAFTTKLSSAVNKLPSFLLSKSGDTRVTNDRRTSARLKAMERRTASRFLCVRRHVDSSVARIKNNDESERHDQLEINKKNVLTKKKAFVWQRVVEGSDEYANEKLEVDRSNEHTVDCKSGIVTRSASQCSVKKHKRFEAEDDFEKISRKFLRKSELCRNRGGRTNGTITINSLPEKAVSSQVAVKKTSTAGDGLSVCMRKSSDSPTRSPITSCESSTTDFSIASSFIDLSSRPLAAAAASMSSGSSSLESSYDSSGNFDQQTAAKRTQGHSVKNSKRNVPATSTHTSDDALVSASALPRSHTEIILQDSVSGNRTVSISIQQASAEDASSWDDCRRSSVVHTPSCLVGFCWFVCRFTVLMPRCMDNTTCLLDDQRRTN
jgi:hypothetical protein